MQQARRRHQLSSWAAIRWAVPHPHAGEVIVPLFEGNIGLALVPASLQPVSTPKFHPSATIGSQYRPATVYSGQHWPATVYSGQQQPAPDRTGQQQPPGDHGQAANRARGSAAAFGMEHLTLAELDHLVPTTAVSPSMLLPSDAFDLDACSLDAACGWDARELQKLARGTGCQSQGSEASVITRRQEFDAKPPSYDAPNARNARSARNAQRSLAHAAFHIRGHTDAPAPKQSAAAHSYYEFTSDRGWSPADFGSSSGSEADAEEAMAGTPDGCLPEDDQYISPAEERRLRGMLAQKQKDLDACIGRLKDVPPRNRKRLRNRYASCVSRLKKKLYVCHLQRELDRSRGVIAALEKRLGGQGERCPHCAPPQHHAGEAGDARDGALASVDRQLRAGSQGGRASRVDAWTVHRPLCGSEPYGDVKTWAAPVGAVFPTGLACRGGTPEGRG